MSVPATVIYFTCYDQLRDYLQYGLGLQGNHVPLISGAIARRKSTTSCWPPSLRWPTKVVCLQWARWRSSVPWSWSGQRCSPAGGHTASCSPVYAQRWLRTACCRCGGGGVPPCSETSHFPVRAAPQQRKHERSLLMSDRRRPRLTGVCLCVFSALYWFNYELVKTQLCQWSQLTQANFSISFTAGAFSGAVSSQTLASAVSSPR